MRRGPALVGQARANRVKGVLEKAKEGLGATLAIGVGPARFAASSAAFQRGDVLDNGHCLCMSRPSLHSPETVLPPTRGAVSLLRLAAFRSRVDSSHQILQIFMRDNAVYIFAAATDAEPQLKEGSFFLRVSERALTFLEMWGK